MTAPKPPRADRDSKPSTPEDAAQTGEPEPGLHLDKLRLLFSLDALLVAGSVTGAAEHIGISKFAMSRRFSQLKAVYNDPLLVRAGKKMVPTPLAEALRVRLRALAAEAGNIAALTEDVSSPAAPRGDLGWQGSLAVEAAPLTVRPAMPIEGMPSPAATARRLNEIGRDAEPVRRLSKYIALISAGPGQSRPLSQEEATDALAIILAGEAEPMQIGGLLMTMFYRGETAMELAGFVAAARAHTGARDIGTSIVDLDWPAYLSPNVKRPPWFMLSAKLVAQAGYRVILHGNNGDDADRAKLEIAARLVDVPVCRSIAEAETAVQENGIAYLPLAAQSSQIFRLLALHRQFGCRSPINLLVPLLNPLGSRVSLLGIAKPTYKRIHCDAAQLLGWSDLSVLTNTRDVAELAPSRAIELHRLVQGAADELRIPIPVQSRPSGPFQMPSRDYWVAIWRGTTRDDIARNTIVLSAALALLALSGGGHDAFHDCLERAKELWATRLDR